jgi:hypothetical protein
MADVHFSHQVVERFFRSELSRGETREFVRHLLRQCPGCSLLVHEVAYEQNLLVLVQGGVEAAISRRQPLVERVLRLVGRGEVRRIRVKPIIRAS